MCKRGRLNTFSALPVGLVDKLCVKLVSFPTACAQPLHSIFDDLNIETLLNVVHALFKLWVVVELVLDLFDRVHSGCVVLAA